MICALLRIEAVIENGHHALFEVHLDGELHGLRHGHADGMSANDSSYLISLIANVSEFQDGDGNPIQVTSMPANLTIVAMPEPASLFLVAGAGIGWLKYCKNRRK